MNEPLFFGVPISLAFLYFIIYSVLGWCMETIYCSVAERRLVPRGFLYGPLCPIYGVGVLMMICWFQPLMGNPVLFYVVATVCMSTWEYMVGWFLETTTHMKYWDYSQYRFNLHGRICLWVCLVWGILSFLVLYFIHPKVAEQVAKLPLIPRYVLDGFFLGVLVADTIATVYQLVRASQMLEQLKRTGMELRAQARQSYSEMGGKLEAFAGRLEDLLPDELDEQGKAIKERYDEMVSRAEYLSRRLRSLKFGKACGSGARSGNTVFEKGQRERQTRKSEFKEIAEKRSHDRNVRLRFFTKKRGYVD